MRKNVTIPRLLTLVLLVAGIASGDSAAKLKGVVIAMGGGNELRKSMRSGKGWVVEGTLTWFSFQPRIAQAMTSRQLSMV